MTVAMVTEAAPGHDEFRRWRHDVRTPLNHILGYGDLLLEEAEAERDLAMEVPLRALLRGGREAQALIERHLASPCAGQGALVALAEAMRVPLAGIEDNIAEIRELNAIPLPSDLGRIESALQQLRRLLSGHLEAEIDEAAVERFNGRVPRSLAGLDDVFDPAASGTILVVDDNGGNREMLGRRLERLGYDVGYAENGGRALDFLTAEAVDLVLLDILMPEMDGYEVLRRLKSDARLRDIPVIVISALDELSSVVRCIEMGAEDHLAKPFDPVLLRARIGACLEKKRLRDQEIEYLAQVTQVTGAAAAVEAGTFEAAELDGVAARPDALGQLARVFQTMAREVRAREERLRRQVQELTIQIDRTRETRQVAEITETDYFKQLLERAQGLRARAGGSGKRSIEKSGMLS